MSVLLERILSRGNMYMALDKVKANKGAGGIDGIEIEDIDQYLRGNWVEIRDKIRKKKVQATAGKKSRNTKAKRRSTKPWNTYSSG